MKNLLKIGIGVGLLFAIVSVPFPFYFLPNLSYATSDSLLMFQVVLIALVSGFIVGCFLGRKLEQQKTLTILKTIIAYILSFYLFKYGFDKLFFNQFYFPEPNILHTPVGHLSKDILFWSSMGSSYWYTVFMGIIEIVPAFLFLRKKTRLLGSFISFGILLNVWAINFGFNISVKLLSSLLLLLSLYLVSFSYKRVYFVFTNNKIDEVEKDDAILKQKTFLNRVLKSILISFFAIEILLPHIEKEERGTITVSPESFTVINVTSGAKFMQDIKRIHIHSKGWVILEDIHQNFKDYSFQVHPTNSSFELKGKKINLKIHSSNKRPTLTWLENGDLKICVLEQIDLSRMSLKDDRSNWIF